MMSEISTALTQLMQTPPGREVCLEVKDAAFTIVRTLVARDRGEAVDEATVQRHLDSLRRVLDSASRMVPALQRLSALPTRAAALDIVGACIIRQ